MKSYPIFVKIKETVRLYAAPFAVRIKKTTATIVEPDISVVCDHEKLDEKGCYGAPDWVIEIVSPSSKKMDYVRKTALYQKTGVREYWIVDLAKNVLQYIILKTNLPKNIPSQIK